MKKYFLYAVAIVIFSVVVVLLRYSDTIIPNWVMWALSFLLIAVLGWISTIGKDNTEDVHTPNTAKEENRYYFYNNRCSFELSKEDIINSSIEKDGLKHTLITKEMPLLIIEIRPCMPDFGSFPVETNNITVVGYPCLEVKMPVVGLTHHYINCGDFVVQVDNATGDFLNSFRLEK